MYSSVYLRLTSTLSNIASKISSYIEYDDTSVARGVLVQSLDVPDPSSARFLGGTTNCVCALAIHGCVWHRLRQVMVADVYSLRTQLTANGMTPM